MRIVLLEDRDARTAFSESVTSKIRASAEKEGAVVELIELRPGDLIHCTGCLQCLEQPGGRCVAKDRLGEYRQKADGCALVVYLSPALFGQCSSTIKTALEKGISLSFAAANANPAQFIVGFGEDLDDEERSTFIDIVEGHMGTADVIHAEMRGVRFEALVARTEEEASSVADKVGAFVRGRRVA